MRYYPSISTRVKEGKEDPPSAPKRDVPWRTHFYALRAKGSKLDNDVVVTPCFVFTFMTSF